MRRQRLLIAALVMFHCAIASALADEAAEFEADDLDSSRKKTLRSESYKVRNFGHRKTKLVAEVEYKITFKGNTAIDISPRRRGGGRSFVRTRR